MNRVEELTLKAVDGAITPEESDELQRLLGADPAARSLHQAVCDTEAALRREHPGPDVRRQVMEQVRLAAAQLQRGKLPPQVPVAKAVVPTPPPVTPPPIVRPATPEGERPVPVHTDAGRARGTGRRSRGRRRSQLPAAIIVAASVLILAGILAFVVFRSGNIAPAPAEPVVVASIVHASGEVVVHRGDETFPAKEGLEIRTGDMVAVPAGARATLQYPDTTRLVLWSNTTLAVPLGSRSPDTPESQKRLELRSGTLVARVAEQGRERPLVLGTPDARAKVLGTHLVLSAKRDATRLGVLEGRVELTRSRDKASLTVPAGHAASTDAETMTLQPFGPQVTEGLVALYPFSESGGNVAHEVWEGDAALDLVVQPPGDALRWLAPTDAAAGGGYVKGSAEPVRLKSRMQARRIFDACRQTNEIAVEAWVAPVAADQTGPARIVTMSESSPEFNFMLGQSGDQYVFRLNTTKTEGPDDATTVRSSPGAVSRRLTHLVYTRDAAGQARLYIDGRLDQEKTVEGDFSSWKEKFFLALGNEAVVDRPEQQRPWRGDFYLVAIYNRALTPSQVHKSFEMFDGFRSQVEAAP